MARFAILLLLLAPLSPAAAQETAASAKVTIFHCTDGNGRLTISDVPCPKGQRQETRTMLRPQDPPPGRVRPAPADSPAPATAAPPPQAVVIRPASPLYECVSADGERYTSDTGEGRPRWVPFWTLGYPVADPAHDARRDVASRRAGGLSAAPASGLSIPPARERVRQPDPPTRPRPPRPGHPGFVGFGYGGGTWVRDTCRALPQAEVCSRLVDRRDDIRTRFFNAQQRERDQLRLEERALNARLANDCGIR